MNFTRFRLDSFSMPGDEGARLQEQLWRRRDVFGWVFLLTLLPIIAAILVLPKQYYAAGSVIIGDQEPSSSVASSAWVQKLGDPADLESQLLIVLSNRMLRLALSKDGIQDAVRRECELRTPLSVLGMGEDCSKLVPNSPDLLAHVQGRYTVQAVGRSRIIAIGYQSPLPDVASMMSNALLLSYLEDQRAENASSREAASEWILNEAKRAGAEASAAAAPIEATGQSPGKPAQSSALRQNFYAELYRKANDIEAERRTLINSARLISFAEVPQLPYFPKRLPLLAAGITLATLLGALIAIRRDVTDRTIRKTRELQSFVNAPLLAKLPRLPRRIVEMPQTRLGLILQLKAADRNKLLTTRVDSFCARLLAAEGNKKLHKILLTSAMAGEGKTFTALVLARAAARTGAKVLLVDCNARAPAVGKRLRIPFGAGLSDILRGTLTPVEVVVSTATPGLDVIESGKAKAGAIVAKAMSGLAQLMEFADRYDLVIFDGPAVDGFAGIAPIAQAADGVICCAEWGVTYPSDVRGAVEALRRHRCNTLGIVLTKVDFEALKSYERPLSDVAIPERG